MSVVTSVVILASILEEDTALDDINAYFTTEGRTMGHTAVNMTDVAHVEIDAGTHIDAIGGWSALQGCLFAGAWNHLDELAFVRHLRAVPWRERETVRVFINREHDEDWIEILLWRDVPAPRVLSFGEFEREYESEGA